MASVYPLNWFPDGSHLLVESSDFHKLSSMSTFDGTTRTLLNETPLYGVAVSPDGTRIAFVGGPGLNEIWMMGPGGEDLHRILTVGATSFVAWSPTSQRIAFASVKGPIENPQEVSLRSCNVVALSAWLFFRMPDYSEVKASVTLRGVPTEGSSTA